jgi:RNA polymerase sigma-70 factor (ECF subfamily)
VSNDDADLVRAVRGGDRTAYAELYDRYAPLVRAVCHDTTRNLTPAQDLSQEVFLKAYRKLGTLRDPDRFAAWLVGIVRNECRDWLRRQMRDKHEYVDRVPDVAEVESTEGDKRTVALIEAMKRLPERERLAVNAFYLQGESVEAIRPVLGLSTSGTYRLLDRARQRLAELLDVVQEDVR